MAIGDPWDTSYNPFIPDLRNEITGYPPWGPDNSDKIPQKDPLSFVDRRGGRFCTEGCGCIDTGCSNLSGARCVLPQELAITVFRGPDGRYEARKAIGDNKGETFYLKYDRGVWRGSRECHWNTDGYLGYPIDPCATTTHTTGHPEIFDPGDILFKESECHYANNKFKLLTSFTQEAIEGEGGVFKDDFMWPDGKSMKRDRWNYWDSIFLQRALTTPNTWPRRGVDSWMRSFVYNLDGWDDVNNEFYHDHHLPIDGTDMLSPSERYGVVGACFESGVLQLGIEEGECLDNGWVWNPNTPVWSNNNIPDTVSYPNAALIGTNQVPTEFSTNYKTARVNIKTWNSVISVDPDGFLSGYSILNGADPDPLISDPVLQYAGVSEKRGCLEDGTVPLKKRPWCRDPVDGTRIQQRCSDLSLEGACLDQNDQDTGDDYPSCIRRLNLGDEVRWVEKSAPVYGDETDCITDGNQWLYNDKQSCLLSGVCQIPSSLTKKEGKCLDENDQDTGDADEDSCDRRKAEGQDVRWVEGQEVPIEDRILKPGCFKTDGTPVFEHTHQTVCERSGFEWRYAIPATCTKYYGNELAKCKDTEGVDTNDQHRETCEENGGIWYENRFISNDWVDWEYERRSCCGKLMLDENHPFHAPQISGGLTSKRKGTVCFSPYSEAILTPSTVSGTVAPMSGAEETCTSTGNQSDRSWFFGDTQSHWTLVIRPCNFWGACFEEGVARPDPGDVGTCTHPDSGDLLDLTQEECKNGICWYTPDTEAENAMRMNVTDEYPTEDECNEAEAQKEEGFELYSWDQPGEWSGAKDNYYETTCGEEVVLFLPLDQFLNCSNFNLTLSDWQKTPTIKEDSRRSGWAESYSGWNPKMGNLHGNPIGDATLVEGWPLTGSVYSQKGFPGDAIERIQHEHWCDYPDGDWDGVGDQRKGPLTAEDYLECQKYIYWNSNDGEYRNELQNAKGADAFYGFNMQPQPFKATEIKQSRAKSMVQAASDKKHWQMCADHKLPWNGGGHWFWEYGPDYFFYYDFVAWDEIGLSGKAGGARESFIKSTGRCDRTIPAHCSKDESDAFEGYCHDSAISTCTVIIPEGCWWTNGTDPDTTEVIGDGTQEACEAYVLSSGYWQPEVICDNEEACEADLNRDGAAVTTCGAGEDGWIAGRECPTLEICVAPLAEEGCDSTWQVAIDSVPCKTKEICEDICEANWIEEHECTDREDCINPDSCAGVWLSGHCERIAYEAKDWIDSHIGHLGRGMCNPPLYVGWIPQSDRDKYCPECEGKNAPNDDGDYEDCGETGSCQFPDETFVITNPKECALLGRCYGPTGEIILDPDGNPIDHEINGCYDKDWNHVADIEEECKPVADDGVCFPDQEPCIWIDKSCDELHPDKGDWRPATYVDCCEWVEGCTLDGRQDGIPGEILVNWEADFADPTVERIYRPAENKTECEKSRDFSPPGAGAIWYELCVPVDIPQMDCPPTELVPDEFLDIVLGDQVGTCLLHKGIGECDKTKPAHCSRDEVPENDGSCDRGIDAYCSTTGEGYCEVDGEEKVAIDGYCDEKSPGGGCWCRGQPVQDTSVFDKPSCLAYISDTNCNNNPIPGLFTGWIEGGDTCTTEDTCESVFGCSSSWTNSVHCYAGEVYCETAVGEGGCGGTWKDRVCTDKEECETYATLGGLDDDSGAHILGYGCGDSEDDTHEWVDALICTNKPNCETAVEFGGCGGVWGGEIEQILCSGAAVCQAGPEEDVCTDTNGEVVAAADTEEKCNSTTAFGGECPVNAEPCHWGPGCDAWWIEERECLSREDCISEFGCEGNWVGRGINGGDPEPVSISPMTQEECALEILKEEYIVIYDENGNIISPTFSPDYIGSSDSKYLVRQNDIVKLRPAGPLTKDLPDESAIKNGFASFGFPREDVSHSMDYWHSTGLYPRGEMASYINDSCLGMTQYKSIVEATNENPIQITARNHLLKDGDLVDIRGVMGNFAANVMTTGDWQETQWEDKIYNKCDEDCDNIIWPNSVCARTPRCLDEDGKEIPNKDKLQCLHGECDKKRANGSICASAGVCESPSKKCAEKNPDGTCPDGFIKERDINFPAGEKCRDEEPCCHDIAGNGKCANTLWENDESLLGCDGTWEGGRNTFESFCDSEKFYACYGEVILGKEPPPAPFFVVQNASVDKFDLYTCDKHPVDGNINNPINLNSEAFTQSKKTSLSWYTGYAHMTDISVAVGDSVEKGQQIGKVGDIGGLVNHLHFGVAEVSPALLPTDHFGFGGNAHSSVEGISFEPRFGVPKCRSTHRIPNRPKTNNTYTFAEHQAIRDTLSFPLDESKNWKRPLHSDLHLHDGYYNEDYFVYPEGSCNLDTAIEADLSKGEPVYVASGGKLGDNFINSVVAAIVEGEGAVFIKHSVVTVGGIGCPDDEPMVCAANPGMSTYEKVAEEAKYEVCIDPNKKLGLPFICDFAARCVDKDGVNVPLVDAEEDCEHPNKWITSRDLSDDTSTVKIEGETSCPNYGTCGIIDNAFGVDESFMTKEDCETLAEVFHTLKPDKPYDSSQKYVMQCYDSNGVADYSEAVIRNPSICEDKHARCHQGDNIVPDVDESQCAEIGGQWKKGYLQIQYNDCVLFSSVYDTLNFDNCWIPAEWKSKLDLEDLSSNTFGKPTISVYKGCPFTGDLMLMNNHEDVGVEAGYVGHLDEKSLDNLYRMGFGGTGYKWEERANDYYVQIEQKGICPVCCDHFMPENLTATMTGQPSEILDIIKCGFDACGNGPLHDGWCCSDGSHACDLNDLSDCKEDPDSFGECTQVWGFDNDGTGRVRRLGCDGCHSNATKCANAGGTFTPIRNLQEFSHLPDPADGCNMFLRKRANGVGTTNCRKCSEVYSSQREVPTYNILDGPTTPGRLRNGSPYPGPVDYDGNSCCPGCDCLDNDQNTDSDYPTCEEALKELPECNIDTAPTTVQLGNLTATCMGAEILDEGLPPYEVWGWVFDPCTCFPEHVAIECMGEKIESDIYCCSIIQQALNSQGIRTNNHGPYETADSIKNCYYNNKGGCYKRSADDTSWNIISSRSSGATEDSCDSDEEWYGGNNGCPIIKIDASADASCYDLPNAGDTIDETCPGLGAIDLPLKFDGVVWRSDWKLMNTVGIHQCGCGSPTSADYDAGCIQHPLTHVRYGRHRFKWASNCRSEALVDDLKQLDLDREPPLPKKTISGTIPAINADCDACDMSQASWMGKPIDALADGGLPRVHGEISRPHLQRDGHFIRLVMGCGSTIPSISAYEGTEARVLQGGFNDANDYRNNGIQIWSEITNCTFVDFSASETLKSGRSTTGTSGSYPCDIEYSWSGETFVAPRGCFDKEGRIGRKPWEETGVPPPKDSDDKERIYAFAGKCVDSAQCGPRGPCIDAGCCKYNGQDMPLFLSGPLWSGAVACSQGGDIKHRCQAVGMDIYPQKVPEKFTVHYVKDVNPVTGEATLVVPAYPAFQTHCEHELRRDQSDTTITDSIPFVGIGVANISDAEEDTLGSYSRNNKSLNPFLPASPGGVIITGCTTTVRHANGQFSRDDHDGIPNGQQEADALGDKGRGNGEFMEIRVSDVSPLITKNPRKNRHLRIFDRTRVDPDHGNVNAGSLLTMNMMLDHQLPQPYGINPWPVDHQTHSDTHSGKWPKGTVMGPDNTESLRKDPSPSLNQPGRVGPLPTMNNLNRMFRYTEEADASGMITQKPEILPVEPVVISQFHNVYSEEDGFCVNPALLNKFDCDRLSEIWIPDFLYTKAITWWENDLSDGEKVVISGSVTYPATCKGVRMGYCKGDTDLSINQCMRGECIDTELGAGSIWTKTPAGGTIDNEVDCRIASNQKQQSSDAGRNPEDSIDIPDLVFKPKGQWIQVFTDDQADQHICEEVFFGDWVVGRINDEVDEKGFYVDVLNDYPLKLLDGVKDFNVGCPIGCKLNGFFLEDPCTPPSEDSPDGQCFECIDVSTDDKEDIRCPLGPADGDYVVRKRGCQHAEYTTKKDCEAYGWVWFGDLGNTKYEFALHGEMNLGTIHNASDLRSDLLKPAPRNGGWCEDKNGGLIDAVDKQECETEKAQGEQWGCPADKAPCTWFDGVKSDWEYDLSSSIQNEDKTNLITQRQRLVDFSSPEAIAMGNDVAIGLGKRNFTGVIYAPQIDRTYKGEQNEGYDKFAEMQWGAVWSRHGGSFDIMVGYPPPKNDCRQANSNGPVNMDFWLDFDQLCCNDRGPLMFHECREKCYHHYQGPTLIDMDLYLGYPGDSIIHVNIHEGEPEPDRLWTRDGSTLHAPTPPDDYLEVDFWETIDTADI